MLLRVLSLMTNTAPNFSLSLNVFSVTWKDRFQIPGVNISFSPGLICKYIYWLHVGEVVLPSCLFLGPLLCWLLLRETPGLFSIQDGVCPSRHSAVRLMSRFNLDFKVTIQFNFSFKHYFFSTVLWGLIYKDWLLFLCPDMLYSNPHQVVLCLNLTRS